VKVHSFTFSFTLELLLAYNLASPCLGREPKARVATAGLGKSIKKSNILSVEKKTKDVGTSNMSTYISLQSEPQIWLFLHAKSFHHGVI
jgi:hypothetical protein